MAKTPAWVSFHDWMNPNWKSLTDASMYLLNQHGFTITSIGPYHWYMALKQLYYK